MGAERGIRREVGHTHTHTRTCTHTHTHTHTQTQTDTHTHRLVNTCHNFCAEKQRIESLGRVGTREGPRPGHDTRTGSRLHTDTCLHLVLHLSLRHSSLHTCHMPCSETLTYVHTVYYLPSSFFYSNEWARARSLLASPPYSIFEPRVAHSLAQDDLHDLLGSWQRSEVEALVQ